MRVPCQAIDPRADETRGIDPARITCFFTASSPGGFLPRDRSQQPVTESVSLDKKPGAILNRVRCWPFSIPPRQAIDLHRCFCVGSIPTREYRAGSLSPALAKDAPTVESGSSQRSQGVGLAPRGGFQAAQFRFDAANGWACWSFDGKDSGQR